MVNFVFFKARGSYKIYFTNSSPVL